VVTQAREQKPTVVSNQTTVERSASARNSQISAPEVQSDRMTSMKVLTKPRKENVKVLDFDFYDKDGDGKIKKEDISRNLKNLGVATEDEALEVAHLLDEDGDGEISRVEWTKRSHKLMSLNVLSGKEKLKIDSVNIDLDQFKDIIMYAFSKLDTNGDGLLSLTEFKQVCSMVGIELSRSQQQKLFEKLSEGKDFILPDQYRRSPLEVWMGAISKALQSQLKKKGLGKIQTVLSNTQSILTDEPRPLFERIQSAAALVWSQAAFFSELVEVALDLLGVMLALSGVANEINCFPSCTEDDIDVTSLAPLLFFLVLSVRDTTRALSNNETQELDEESALAFLCTFKRAGVSRSDFQAINRLAEVQMATVKEKQRFEVSEEKPQLCLIVRGEMEAIKEGMSPGFSEPVAVLKPGAFIGGAKPLDMLGESQWQTADMNVSYLMSSQDTLLLCWDMHKLRQYLVCDEFIRERVKSLIIQSIATSINQWQEKSAQVAEELPDLFQEFTLGVRRRLKCQRAAIWIYNGVADELWTLLMNATTKEYYISMDAKTGGLAAAAFNQGEVLNIPDVYERPEFNRDVDRQTGFHTKSMLCSPVPAVQEESSFLGVLQAINKEDDDGNPVEFSDEDEQKIQDIMWLVQIIIDKIQIRYKGEHSLFKPPDKPS